MAGPRVKQITAAQKEEFLQHVREGMNRAQAAAQLGITGSRFRSLANRDEAFNTAYEEACVEGRGNFQDAIRSEFHRRAFDIELGTYSHRFLHDLFVIHCSEAFVLRRVEAGTTNAAEVKQQIDVAIEHVLDELAARREAKVLRASEAPAVAGNGKASTARTSG